MNSFFKSKLNTVLSIILVVLAVGISVEGLLHKGSEAVDVASLDSAYTDDKTAQEVFADKEAAMTQYITDVPTTVLPSSTAPVTTTRKKVVKPTVKPTQKPTAEPTVPFATAIPAKEPADYDAQYSAGYLIAIDNPDKIYECERVKLTDKDRDLLERLCFGEFGVGGFVGAALIAQAVKDAMCFDGYRSVAEVIKSCHYTGSVTSGTTEECKQAVRYIFDENHDAVQHRIMYMYNPDLVSSAFHESQNYILTYQRVRFFDRWNY